jgi:hypothetical protein
MKRILLTITFLLIALVMYAPEYKSLYIIEGNVINYYDRIIKAVVAVESSGGKILYNKAENAVGAFQIRPIRLRDYNERTGSKYQMKDLYRYEISKKIFLYYAKKDGTSYESIAKNWNKSRTNKYWNQVKKKL